MERKTETSQDLLMVGLQDKSPFTIEPPRKKPSITKPEVSSVLTRVAAFLPKFKESNDLLFQNLEQNKITADQVNVEVVDDEQPYISMNLGFISSEDEGGDENLGRDHHSGDDEEEEEDNQNEEPHRDSSSSDDHLIHLQLPGSKRKSNKPSIVELLQTSNNNNDNSTQGVGKGEGEEKEEKGEEKKEKEENEIRLIKV